MADETGDESDTERIRQLEHKKRPARVIAPLPPVLMFLESLARTERLKVHTTSLVQLGFEIYM